MVYIKVVKRPTHEQVREMVEVLQAKGHLTQAEISEMIGMSEGGLKKTMLKPMYSSARQMSMSSWQMLLLHAGRHPEFQLVRRGRGTR